MSQYEIHLAPRTWGAGEKYLDIPVDIKLSAKDEVGRNKVILRSTGQLLGYVWQSHTPDSGGAYWKAGITNSAYYPACTDVMTRTVRHESHHGDWHELEIHPVSSRYDAMQEILYTLASRAAASVEPLVEIARRPFIIQQAEAGQKWAIDHLVHAAKQEV